MTEFSDEPESSHEVVFLLRADIAIQEIFTYYENLREGRGCDFLAAVQESEHPLRRFPRSGRAYYKQFRRLLISEQRYGLFYSIEGRRVMVAAVVGVQQDAKSIRRLLDGL